MSVVDGFGAVRDVTCCDGFREAAEIAVAKFNVAKNGFLFQ